jgi:hypothetical protein
MLDTHLSSGAGTIGQVVAGVPSGLRTLHEIKNLNGKIDLNNTNPGIQKVTFSNLS